MKYLGKIVIILALTLAGHLTSGPFWYLIPAGFIGGLLIITSPRAGFFCGFFAVSLLYFATALQSHVSCDGRLTERVSILFLGLHPLIIVLVATLPGALAAGFAALTGSYFRELFIPPKTKRKNGDLKASNGLNL